MGKLSAVFMLLILKGSFALTMHAFFLIIIILVHLNFSGFVCENQNLQKKDRNCVFFFFIVFESFSLEEAGQLCKSYGLLLKTTCTECCQINSTHGVN